MDKFVVETIEDRLLAWRGAEDAALKAEEAVASMGQAVPGAEALELLIKAEKLRAQADRLFAAIVRSVKLDESA